MTTFVAGFHRRGVPKGAQLLVSPAPTSAAGDPLLRHGGQGRTWSDGPGG